MTNWVVPSESLGFFGVTGLLLFLVLRGCLDFQEQYALRTFSTSPLVKLLRCITLSI